MLTTRSYPLRELDHLDRIAQQFFGSTVRPSTIPLEAYRAGDEYVVTFDLPGVTADSIDVTVDGPRANVLTVRAERPASAGEGRTLIASEHPVGKFSRRITLSDTLDASRVTADYDGGVLTVRIPVAETARPRKIEINRGGQPEAVSA
jgi:HSP20 family protein